MSYLKQFIRENKEKLLFTLLMLLGQVVGTLLIPYQIAGIVDDGILKGDMNTILRIGGMMLVVSLLATVVAVIGSFYSADLAAGFGRDMRNRIFKKSQELSVNEFNAIGVSSMITRTTSDISNLQQTLGMTLQLIIPAPVIIIVSIVMTAQINGAMALILVGCIVVFILISIIILRKSNDLSKTIQVRLDKINKVIREAITGIRVIRAFGNEKYEENRSNDAFSSYAGNMIRLNKLFAVFNPIVWFIMGLTMAAILWLGGGFSLQGSMELGSITAVTEYAIITLGYLIMAVSTIVTLPKMYACLKRLEEVLDIAPEITDTAVNKDQQKNSEDICPVIEFDHVSFYYNGAEEPVLKSLSFECRPGQTMAIIGGTGSGKSTIIDLMLRLHDVSDGSIRLNGMDIRDMSQEKLHEAIGYVPQKAFLFSGTIEDNLRMGYANADAADIERALAISQSENFVSGLSKGIHAPVAPGGQNFSGGQKQRLSIARALIKKAPVYIFDDSFSALDVKTDASLRQALKDQVTDAVKIIVAQRVSTIMDADNILVLDDGQLAGIGRHETLMKQCPLYQAIAKSQMNLKEA